MVANKPKMARPEVYQFRWGDLVITNLLEGHVQRDNLHPFAADNVEAPEVEALAKEFGIPYPHFEHTFTPTLVDTGKKLIAFDPGFGQAAPTPTAGHYNDLLPAAGYTKEDVDLIVITHCHPDHIGNLMTDGKPTFPNAEIMFGRVEFDYWRKGENILDRRQPTLALFRKVAEPMGERATFVEADQEIAPGITAVNAFGHSAGHMAYRIESGGKELMLLSDTVAHYAVSLTHPEWHFSNDDDAATAEVSRKRVLGSVAGAKCPCIGFHMPFPSVGWVDRRPGGGYQWVPATYQFNLG